MSIQSFIQQKYNQDEILIGFSCQVILPILFKFVFPNYICLSLYLFVNSTIESLYIPIFSSLFSIWIFLLFRSVPYCLIIFHVFFFLFDGFPLVLEDCKEHNLEGFNSSTILFCSFFYY